MHKKQSLLYSGLFILFVFFAHNTNAQTTASKQEMTNKQRELSVLIEHLSNTVNSDDHKINPLLILAWIADEHEHIAEQIKAKYSEQALNNINLEKQGYLVIPDMQRLTKEEHAFYAASVLKLLTFGGVRKYSTQPDFQFYKGDDKDKDWFWKNSKEVYEAYSFYKTACMDVHTLQTLEGQVSFPVLYENYFYKQAFIPCLAFAAMTEYMVYNDIMPMNDTLAIDTVYAQAWLTFLKNGLAPRNTFAHFKQGKPEQIEIVHVWYEKTIWASSDMSILYDWVNQRLN